MSQFNRIAVVGAGLIGGSVLLAASKRKAALSFAGWSHSKQSREHLRGFAGVEVFDSAVAAVHDADLVVVATPVDKIRETFIAITPGLKSGALVTDVGSVKSCVLNDASVLPKTVTFIGSHPMAGSEKAGIAQARADLFDGKVCFITASVNETAENISRIRDFWKSLGAITSECSAQKHDALVAITSHVPHASAAALMLAVSQSSQFSIDAAGSGLRDATRIAAGEENLWVGILLANAEHVIAGLNSVEKILAELRDAIKAGDKDRVAALLKAARLARQALDSSR